MIAGMDSEPVKSAARWATWVASAESGRYVVRSLEETSSTRPKYGPPDRRSDHPAEDQEGREQDPQRAYGPGDLASVRVLCGDGGVRR